MEVIKENRITLFRGFKVTDRALLVNDIHISREKVNDFRENWKEAVSTCKAYAAKTIIVGGDIFESRHAQTLNVLMTIKWALEYAENENIFVILANGNHDKVHQESVEGYCHIFDRHPNVSVIDEWGVITTPNANIFVLAYFPEQGSLKDKLDDIMSSKEFSNGNRNVLYAHAGVMGALGRDMPTEIDKGAFDKFDVTYMGHYHDRSVVGSNIYYIGSSRQFNYGENIEKGYNVCDSYGDLTFVQNEVNSRMVTLRLKYDDLATIDKKIDEIRSNSPVRCLIKAVIEVNSHNRGNIDRADLTDKGINRVEVVYTVDKLENQEAQAAQAMKRYDGAQIVDTYKEYCEECNINPEVGIKYLKQ